MRRLDRAVHAAIEFFVGWDQMPAVLARPLDPARYVVAAEAADPYVGLAYDRNARWVIPVQRPGQGDRARRIDVAAAGCLRHARQLLPRRSVHPPAARRRRAPGRQVATTIH